MRGFFVLFCFWWNHVLYLSTSCCSTSWNSECSFLNCSIIVTPSCGGVLGDCFFVLDAANMYSSPWQRYWSLSCLYCSCSAGNRAEASGDPLMLLQSESSFYLRKGHGPTHWPSSQQAVWKCQLPWRNKCFGKKKKCIWVSKVVQWPKVMRTKNKACFENSEGLSAPRGRPEGSCFFYMH